MKGAAFLRRAHSGRGLLRVLLGGYVEGRERGMDEVVIASPYDSSL
jgi:hypothetical protein